MSYKHKTITEQNSKGAEKRVHVACLLERDREKIVSKLKN
jgi:hypothetical protein